MVIVYRDTIGLIEVYLDTEIPVAFCDGYCYFTSIDGVDSKIPVSALEWIGIPNLA